MEAVSLMSTDVDRLISGLLQLIEIWAQIIEVTLGTWLLWRQLGNVAIAPILVVLICFGGQSLVSRFMPKRQAIWLKAISTRVKYTSNILRSMKSVKLAGLVEISINLLQQERIRELNLGKSSRWLLVWQNAVGNTPPYTHVLTILIIAATSTIFTISSMIISISTSSL